MPGATPMKNGNHIAGSVWKNKIPIDGSHMRRKKMPTKYRIERVYTDGLWYLWKDERVLKTGELETIFAEIRKLEGLPERGE